MLKKVLFLFIPITSILLLIAIMGAYFMENIKDLMELGRANNLSITPEPYVQILLCLSLVGLVGIFRKRNK